MSTTTEMTLEVFEGAEIAFRGDAWINATQMAARFGKTPKDFLRTDAAKAFIAELEFQAKGQKCLLVRKGGVGGRESGTWMHPELGLEFARWLSPKLAIWCNQTVRRVLAGGQATADNATVLNVVGRLLERIERLEASAKSAPMPAYALPERASFAPHVIEIVHKHPKPRPVPTGETMVCGLLSKLLNFYETFNARLMVHPHTLVDIARRDGQFAPWLAAADKKHEAIKFIQNLRPYFNRDLRFAKGDSTCYTLHPQGSGSGRVYIITRRDGVGLPQSGPQSGDQAIAIVAAALGAGEKVQVVS